jgi:hypothetical protein
MKVPVGIGNVGMAKVCAQSGHMEFDRFWIAAALFERTDSKTVTEIVKMRTGMTFTGPQSYVPDQLQEH